MHTGATRARSRATRPARRAVSGFTLYDVANSAFVTTVVTAVGGPFLTALAEAAAGADGRVSPARLAPRAGSLFAYAVSLSVLLQVLALPLLGALADRPTAKRRLLRRRDRRRVGRDGRRSRSRRRRRVLLGLLAFVVANVAYGAAILAYNAYLADVAELPDRDRVSARGFAFGYAGGASRARRSPWCCCTTADPLGIEPRHRRAHRDRRCRRCGGSVLGVVAVRRLDAVRRLPWAVPDSEEPLREAVRGSVAGLRASLRALRALPGTARYLVSFLLFNDAIQAVVALSAVVLAQELFVAKGQDADDATPFLLQLILLIQVVAVFGAAGQRPAGPAPRRQADPARHAGRLGRRRAVRRGRAGDDDAGVRAGRRHRAGARRVAGARAVAVLRRWSRTTGSRRSSASTSWPSAGPPGSGRWCSRSSWTSPAPTAARCCSLLVLFAAGGLLLAATDTDAAVEAAQEPVAQ